MNAKAPALAVITAAIYVGATMIVLAALNVIMALTGTLGAIAATAILWTWIIAGPLALSYKVFRFADLHESVWVPATAAVLIPVSIGIATFVK